MKKVLIIANLFHASPRMPAAAKYLPDFGWEPTILTVPIREDPKILLAFPRGFKEKARIIETSYPGDVFSFWRRVLERLGFRTDKSMLNQAKERTGVTSKKSFIDFIFYFYQTLFAYPDEEKKWEKPALEKAEELLEKENFDFILSSSSPVTAHIVAHKLKEKYRIPWLADLRDLWTQNCDYPYFSWRKLYERKLEKKILALADALVTVSQPLVEMLEELHKSKRAHNIVNSFDPEKINNPPAPLTSNFTITYTGQIYIGRRDPTKFLLALKELISEKKINPNDLEVRFFGPETTWLEQKIKDYKLSGIVKQYGKHPRKVAFEKQRESQLLLLLNWKKHQSRGVYTGKIFEYLAACRPILATEGGKGEGNVIKKLLEETKTGFSGEDIEEIKEIIKNFYLEYKNKGKVIYKGDREKVNRYNHRSMAEKFSKVFNRVLGSNQNQL